jgi:hypothetical protein
MTVQHGARPVGYDALRDLPLDELFDELSRIGRLLRERADGSSSQSHSPTARDHAAAALRARERALVAEIRRRPGGTRPWSARVRGSQSD